MDRMGTVTVSEKAVMQLAAHISGMHDGVVRLADKNSRDSLSRAVTGRGDTRGVYVTKSPEGLSLEICVICRYGTNTIALCNDIAGRIKDELSGTGIRVKNVNVRIMGVE